MSFNLDIPQKQTIALLNLSVRDSEGVPTYSTAIGDNTYSAAELTRAGQSAVTDIMRAICETEGHPHRACSPQRLRLLTANHCRRISVR
jgi:hypothetical protein